VQRLAARKPAHIEFDDLLSWGIVGLLDAIKKYDPAKEASFATYAQFASAGRSSITSARSTGSRAACARRRA
jgi:DNA-directed RNA polymerase specialized sigma subunit